jgi:hypothetical protein
MTVLVCNANTIAKQPANKLRSVKRFGIIPLTLKGAYKLFELLKSDT